MVIAELEKILNRVETTFVDTAAGFQPLARSLMRTPSLDLSRILLGVLALGAPGPDDRAVCACRALELLDQALGLGAAVASDLDYDEDRLLVTDYLYGQAIDQVIGVGEPAVIDALAAAIAGAAEDKVACVEVDYRPRLMAAALDISLILGDFSAGTLAAICAAKSAARSGAAVWAAALPAGAITQFLGQRSSAAANG